MLKAVFGNQNVGRILLFLFVNEKCYASQIQSLLQVPLTPIQKALIRLEKEELIYSHCEGKTRIYQFNPSHPLRFELEALLKKAYTLLPSQEKKRYCFIHKPKLRFKEEGERVRRQKNILLLFWEQLAKVKHLTLSAKSKGAHEQSTKMGKAEVVITSPSASSLVFQEKGHWLLEQLPSSAFTNSFRWTLDVNASLITLEHLRYGPTHPVFLFHFTPFGPHMLETVDAHLCNQDTYLGNIAWDHKRIEFRWRIIGPNKNDELTYYYF
jgi:hypothetical protein